MDRLIGTLLVLIAVALVMPTLAALVVGAVPSLITLLIALGLVRLVLRPRRRR
jgi:Flp pilus assembly protein TadB